MTLKAWKCEINDNWAEGADIVFAPDRNSAKKEALQSGPSCSEQVHEYDGNPLYWIRATRLPDLDQYAEGTEPYSLYFFTKENIHIWRSAGFYELDKDTCDTCGCSDYDQEQYRICEGCGQCGECGCSCCKEHGKYACTTCDTDLLNRLGVSA